MSRPLSCTLLTVLLHGCFAAQPPPPCTVVTGQAVFQVSNYFAVLDKTAQTGTCSLAPSATLNRLEVGLARVDVPATRQHRVVIRASYPVQVAEGLVYSGNEDATNDCSVVTSPGQCAWCIAMGAGSAAVLSDGGTAVAWLADGGLDAAPDGGARGALLDGGARINLRNTCGATDEPLARADPSDPTRLNSSARTRGARRAGRVSPVRLQGRRSAP